MRNLLNICIFLVTLTGLTTTVYAQEEEPIQLRLRRDWGYGGGVDIQGNFSLSVSGPENLNRVEYFIDSELMGESIEAPSFRFKFVPDAYPLGLHTLSAIGHTSDDQTFRSNEITKNFVSAQEGYSTAIKIVAIILGLILGVSVLSFLITRLVGGGKKSGPEPGAQRSYGLLGGTICPKCSKPFSRHIWGLNMGVGKFDRCPHCGKWSITTRATPAELRTAELSELDQAETKIGTHEISEEERLRKDLEDSRFDNL